MMKLYGKFHISTPNNKEKNRGTVPLSITFLCLHSFTLPFNVVTCLTHFSQNSNQAEAHSFYMNVVGSFY